MTGLVPRPQGAVYATGHTTDALDRTAAAFAQSGYFQDARQSAQAAVKILAGQELGIGPFAAMSQIHIVQGRATIGAHMLAALVRRAGYDFRVVEHTTEACTIRFLRGDEVLGESSFTKADAAAAGLWAKPGPWKQHPRNMLWSRAMSNGVKWLMPEVTTGAVYTPDELASGDVDDVSEIIRGQVAPDWRERAEAVLAIAPGRESEAKRALQQAGLSSQMLVDDDEYDRARRIVADMPEVADDADPEPSSEEGAGWEMSDGQRRKLWATINASGWSDDGARAVVASVTGDRSTSSITSRAMYDDVLVLLEAGPSPVEGEPELWDEPTSGDRETTL